MGRATLEEKLKNLPELPGVYIFKDRKGEILYIGKAKVLKKRVKYYFQTSRVVNAKSAVLISKIHSIDYIITDSEVEALILEANLVKEYSPRYNVNLKDDKSYPYIRITAEPFPRVFLTRRIVKDGSRYFGPYTDVKSMRETLRVMKKVFPVRSCSYRIDDETISKGKVKVCLDFHIKKCDGPCEGKVSEEDYRDMIEQVIDFLNGKTRGIVCALREKMSKHSENLNFEEAARIRDQITLIKNHSDKQRVSFLDAEDRDIVGVARGDEDACGVVFRLREGKLIARENFFMEGVENKDRSEILDQFLNQYYIKVDFIPGEIILQEKIEHMDVLKRWLSDKRGAPVRVISPVSGNMRKIVMMCEKNASLLLDEYMLQKTKKRDYISLAVRTLQKDLNMNVPPRRIEAFDISNLGERDAVGGMVTFINGYPRKSEYRRFKIKKVRFQDDYAMMAEVVKRRYIRVLKEKLPLPDLILIDGGIGHLSAVKKVLDSLNLKDQPIIGLAKRLEEVYKPGLSDPQNIARNSPGLNLLRRIRDESHRFAIEYHRKLRKKGLLRSELDSVPGVGEKRKSALLNYFKSVRNIKSATVHELTKVEGISLKTARVIKSYLESEDLGDGSG